MHVENASTYPHLSTQPTSHRCANDRADSAADSGSRYAGRGRTGAFSRYSFWPDRHAR